MRRTIVLAALLLAPIALAQSPTSTPRDGDMATVFTFRLPYEERRGAEALADPGLTGPDAWTARAEEILRRAVFSFGGDGARLRVERAPVPGTAWLSQGVPLVAWAYELTVETSSTGDFVGYAFLVRESGAPSGSHDTLFEAPATGGATKTLAWRWTPRDPASTDIEVFLRVAFAGGDGADVRFSRASFVPLSTTRWSFGDGTLDESGEAVTHRYASPGDFDVTARLRHPGEEATTQRTGVSVVNRPPVPAFTATRLGASSRFLLDAEGAFDPDAGEARLRDAQLEDVSAWTLVTSEVGVDGSIVAADGALRITTPPTARPGTVFLLQSVPIVPGRAMRFDANVSDAGGIERYEIILREAGSPDGIFDHVLSHPPVGDVPTHLRLDFAPRFADSTHVVVHLRAVVAAGAAPDVRFHDARLVDGLTLDWSVDGSPLPTSSRTTEVALPSGSHRVRLTVTDAGGLSRSLEQVVDATLTAARPTAAIDAPLFALEGAPAIFRATPSRPSAATEAFLDVGLVDPVAWIRFLPEGTTLAFDGEGNATLIVDPVATGPAELGQRVPVDATARYEFKARLRAEAATEVDLVVRELRVRPDGSHQLLGENVERVGVGNVTRDVRVVWRATSSATTHVHALVRVDGGEVPVVVDVVAPSFAPAMEYRWSFAANVSSSDRAEGFAARAYLAPGAQLAVLEVVDAAGARASASMLVPVLDRDALRALPTIAGGFGLSWAVPSSTSFVAWEVERTDASGSSVERVPFSSPLRHVDQTPVAGARYDIFLVGANGTRAWAANVSVAANASAARLEAPSSFARGAEVPLVVDAPADAVAVEAVLEWGPLSVARAPLAPDAEGRWRGVLRAGAATLPADHTLRIVASDEAGRGLEIARTEVDVELAEGAVGWFLLLALLLPLAAWGVRAGRARGWIRWLGSTR